MATIPTGYTPLPRVDRYTAEQVRRDFQDSAHVEKEETLLRANGHLYDAVARGAREIAGDDLELRQKIMRYGGEMLEITRRTIEIIELETRFQA